MLTAGPCVVLACACITLAGCAGVGHRAGAPDAKADATRAAFDAQDAIVLMERRPDALVRMREAYEQLVGIGRIEAADQWRMHDALIQMRHFEAAAELAALLQIEPVQVRRLNVAGRAPNAYGLVAGRPVLEERIVDLAGTLLLVVFDPRCSPSARAGQIVSARLARPGAPRALFLVPAVRGLPVAAVTDWMDAHPAVPLLMATSDSAWPMVGEWDTPNFYLLVDGAVRDHFTGWPPGGRLERLDALLEAASDVRAPRGAKPR